MDYEESVMEAADERGLLSQGDAMRLLAQHQVTWEEWRAERPMGALPTEARPLLHFLGY